MTIHPPASGSSSQPFAGARHTAHTHTARYHHQPVFLFFSFFLFGFFLVLWFFLLPLLFFREPQATISYHARAHRVLFYFFWFFFFDFIASPLVRTGHHSRGSQQQHALTFIQMGTIRYSPAFHLFYLWCYDDDQSRKELPKKKNIKNWPERWEYIRRELYAFLLKKKKQI